MSERNLLEQLYFKTEEAVQLPVIFGFLAFLIKHIGLPRGKSFWAKIESSSRGTVLQATDLLYPPRLPMLFASRAVCKFSSLILKILAWIRYHQLYPPYSIHLPWYNHLVFFFFGFLWQVFTYQLLSGGSFWKTDNNIIIPISPYNS